MNGKSDFLITFFVYKEFSPYKEHKRSENLLTPKIIHNI